MKWISKNLEDELKGISRSIHKIFTFFFSINKSVYCTNCNYWNRVNSRNKTQFKFYAGPPPNCKCIVPGLPAEVYNGWILESWGKVVNSYIVKITEAKFHHFNRGISIPQSTGRWISFESKIRFSNGNQKSETTTELEFFFHPSSRSNQTLP